MFDKIFVDFFLVITQLPFTISEMELEFYHLKVNVIVVLRVAKRLKT